ncbi:MAG: hypothetical protein MUD01_17130 [Chloroflexaceae bacterium]|jgi:uncharacterized membrane protein|nr:hypothetical protein [Chloroflexaceae bacterium]
MVNTTFIYGGFLALLGIVGYVAAPAESRSLTALIPTFLGIPVLAAAFAGRNEGWRKHAMHVAVVLGLLGLLAALSRLVPALASGDPIGLAAISLALLAIASAVYVGLGVRSFIEARRQRTAA